MWTKRVPVALLTAALVAAACGGGTAPAGPSPAGSPAPTLAADGRTATPGAAASPTRGPGVAPPMPPSDQPPSPTTGGSPPPTATAGGPAATSTPAVVEATTIQGPQPTPDPAVPVQAARGALAARLGVGVDAVQVVAVERVDWPDGCLGAADPGEACILMITPGYRVTLAVNGVEYVYHTDGGTRVRPERGRPVAPSAAQ